MRDAAHKRKRNRKKPYYQPQSQDMCKEKPFVGCTGKRRYPDLLAAHAGAHHMSLLQGDSDVYLYLCGNCGGYHLTKAKISPDGKLNRWAYFFGKD